MSSPQGPLQGHIYYEDHRGGFWDKIGSVLAGAGHALKEALPYMAQAASIYASSLGNSSSRRSYNESSGWDLPSQSSYHSQPIPMPEPIRPRPLPEYKSEPIARNALAKLAQQRIRGQTPAPDWTEMQARSNRVLNEIASAQGLPSYEQFHHENGVAYNIQPRQSTLEAEWFVEPSSQSRDFVQEEYGQIQRNLSHPQQPITYHATIQPQSRFSSPSEVLSALLTNLPKAEYRDPYEGKIDLWQKVRSGIDLSDAELKQLFHSIDLKKYGAKTEKDKPEAEMVRLHAEEQLVRNMVANAERDAEGNVLLQGVSIRPEDAHYFAKQDIQHFQDTDLHLRPDQLLAMHLTSQEKKKKSPKAKRFDMRPGHFQKQTQHLKNYIEVGNIIYPFQSQRTSIGINNTLEAAGIFMSKERHFYIYFMKKFVWDAKGEENRKITWPELPDIVDYIARHTDTDEEFRLQLWFLFGTNVDAPMTQFVDAENPNLPKKYKNTGSKEEQFHHFLGGVTGDLNFSHLYNEPVEATLSELPEAFKRQTVNWGDIRLFNDTRWIRDDFVRNGRDTVAPNMRKWLKENQGR